jgi:hypothetical protein
MPDMRDRKVWKVWGWEVWPPEDYDAIYKIAPIIEGCRHLSPDQTPCKMCIDAASIALGHHGND